jgi:hypothetical protein
MKLRDEISELEKRIGEYQKELRNRYQFSYWFEYGNLQNIKNHLSGWFFYSILIILCFNKPPVMQQEVQGDRMILFAYEPVCEGTMNTGIVGNI